MKETYFNRANQEVSLVHLFLSFLRLGITAFGGPAMIAYIRKRVVIQKQWLDGESFQNGVALCQTIPGATVMQMSAYIGLRIRGVKGAIVSFIGFGLSAFLLMMIFSVLYTSMHSLHKVASAFSGLQAIIIAIITYSAITFGKASLRNWKCLMVAMVAAVLFGLREDPILIILLSALLGILSSSDHPASLPNEPLTRMMHMPTAWVVFFPILCACLMLLFFLHRQLFELAVLMSKIDMLAFGGGFASVPLMYHEFVEIRSWIDGPTFLNGVILGQFTPGPIVITAAFVGYLVHGLQGAFVATIAIFLPSFLIVIGVAPWFDRLRALPYFSRMINGILCSFIGLLIIVAVRFGFQVHWDSFHVILASAAFGALLLNLDILWVVGLGTIVSVFII